MPKHSALRLTDVDPVHTWFGLSYAQYLTIPRSVMQAMPQEWQQRMTACLIELDDTIDWRPKKGTYRVQLMTIEEEYDEDEERDIRKWGHQIGDPFDEYRRPVAMPFREKAE